MPNPLDSRVSAVDVRNNDDIETGREMSEFPALLQELHCGADQPTSLAKIHTGGSSTEVIAGSGAHFDNREGVALARHDVQLAEAAAKIPAQDFEPAGVQELSRDVLRSLAD
jgi:hypothetical protein